MSATMLALFLLVTPAAQDDDDPEEASGYEVSFGGQYRIIADGSNFDFHPRTVVDDPPPQSFVNQRFRTWLNFHDRESRTHGVYFQVEIGHIVWGDDLEFPKTYEANGADVGVELRRGFLWYKPNERSLLRVGILDWHDRFGERPRSKSRFGRWMPTTRSRRSSQTRFGISTSPEWCSTRARKTDYTRRWG